MNYFEKKQWIRIACCAVVVLAAVLWLTGAFSGKPVSYYLKNRGDLGPVTEADIEYVVVKTPEATSQDGTVSAKDWEAAFPYIVATMGDNKENTYVTSYLEQDPYLVNIYEGYGFAKDYGSARGHAYTLEDVAKTERPHAKANCLTCKTPNFTKLVNDEGVSVYSRPFDEVMSGMEENISCYTCHGNEAGNNGQIVITHSYVDKALGENAKAIDPKVLNCGQCHIEYYFTPEDSETMMPYHSVAEMTPEAILAYYDEMGFYDWIQPSTGTKMLKAQHPEMETFLQGKHAGLLSCADCHMPLERNEDGVVYHSHKLVSPLENETLLADCASCHGDTDMVTFVHNLQNRVTTRETEVGNKLSALKDALAAAVEAGNKPEVQLDGVRELHRKAQWFFDFDYVENAEGAHNSSLAMECLNTSEQYIDEAMALLEKELHPIDVQTMMRAKPDLSKLDMAPEAEAHVEPIDPQTMMRAKPDLSKLEAAPAAEVPAEPMDPQTMMRAKPDLSKLDIAPAAEAPVAEEPAEAPAEPIDPQTMMRAKPDLSKLDAAPAAEALVAEEPVEAPVAEEPVEAPAEPIDPQSMMRAKPDLSTLEAAPAAEALVAEEPVEAPVAEEPAKVPTEPIDPQSMMRAKPDLNKLEVAPAAEAPLAEESAEAPVDEEPAEAPAEPIDPQTMMRAKPDLSKLDTTLTAEAPLAEEPAEAPVAEEPAEAPAEPIDPQTMMRPRPIL